MLGGAGGHAEQGDEQPPNTGVGHAPRLPSGRVGRGQQRTQDNTTGFELQGMLGARRHPDTLAVGQVEPGTGHLEHTAPNGHVHQLRADMPMRAMTGEAHHGLVVHGAVACTPDHQLARQHRSSWFVILVDQDVVLVDLGQPNVRVSLRPDPEDLVLTTLRSALSIAAPSIAALSVAALFLAGCSGEPAADAAVSTTSGSTGDGGTRVVATEQGDVTVPVDPQRIVVLNAALTGYLYALDVPVHGSIPVNTQATTFPDLWADQAAEDGTVQVAWTDEGFDLEALAVEDPDLIIGGGQGFPAVQAGQAYEQLSAIAPTVLVSSELTTWQEQLQYLAEDVLDVPDAEQELLQTYADRVTEVREAITLPPTPVGFLLLTADGTPYSIPEDAQLPRTLAEIGFDPLPVIADNPELQTFGSGDSFELSRETVGTVITAPTVFVLGFQADTTSAAELAADPVYASLPAFSGGNAYDLPATANRADFYATMDLLDVVEQQFG